MHEHSGLDEEGGRLEQVVYDTCSFVEFSAFNEKVTQRYRYPGEGGIDAVDYNCRRQLSSYKGSRLCETSERP